MNFFSTLITNFFSNIIESFNNIIKYQEKKINLKRITLKKLIFLITFTITFLLGNFTALLAIIFKDALGTYGLFFPISSCILLYSISLFSIKNIIFYSGEAKYYERELKEIFSNDTKK